MDDSPEGYPVFLGLTVKTINFLILGFFQDRRKRYQHFRQTIYYDYTITIWAHWIFSRTDFPWTWILLPSPWVRSLVGRSEPAKQAPKGVKIKIQNIFQKSLCQTCFDGSFGLAASRRYSGTHIPVIRLEAQC